LSFLADGNACNDDEEKVALATASGTDGNPEFDKQSIDQLRRSRPSHETEGLLHEHQIVCEWLSAGRSAASFISLRLKDKSNVRHTD
jgi:hypothetical protein